MQDESRITSLLLKHFDQSISPEERVELDNWLADPANQSLMGGGLSKGTALEQLQALSRMNSRRMDARVMAVTKDESAGFTWRRAAPWLAAASIVGILVVSALLFHHGVVATEQAVPVKYAQHDIQPGSNKATLVLGNGSRIILDSAGNGMLASQGNSKVLKIDSGQLNYKAGHDPAVNTITYNTLYTPRAGQFQVTLADGTKVWLNNASSLTYPVAFSSNERQVELTGEAYFEVAKDAHRPFRVKLHDQVIEVLGTSFNASSYNDEPISTTTLIDGSVRVLAGQNTVRLSPGQQARVSGTDLRIAIPDIKSVIAWRRGFFNFSNADLAMMMRQISRWYDIEVVYQGANSNNDKTYDGLISRDLKLSDVMAVLETLQVHTRLQDGKLYVTP